MGLRALVCVAQGIAVENAGRVWAWLGAHRGYTPIGDGKCAEALDEKGVATVPACRVRAQCVEVGETNR